MPPATTLPTYDREDEHVRPLTREESGLYERIASITKRPAVSLSSKWREPSFTVHNIQVSGPRSRLFVFPGKLTNVLNPPRSYGNPFSGKIASISADSTGPEFGHSCRQLVRVPEGGILRLEVPQFDRGNGFRLRNFCSPLHRHLVGQNSPQGGLVAGPT